MKMIFKVVLFVVVMGMVFVVQILGVFVQCLFFDIFFGEQFCVDCCGVMLEGLVGVVLVMNGVCVGLVRLLVDFDGFDLDLLLMVKKLQYFIYKLEVQCLVKVFVFVGLVVIGFVLLDGIVVLFVLVLVFLCVEDLIVLVMEFFYVKGDIYLWIINEVVIDCVCVVVVVLQKVVEVGLNLVDYKVDELIFFGDFVVDWQKLMIFELEMIKVVLIYIQDDVCGCIDLNCIFDYYEFKCKDVNFKGVFVIMQCSLDVVVYLLSCDLFSL